MRAIVTVKLPPLYSHDPRNKRTGKCPIKGNRVCTDVTGSHHSYLDEGETVSEIRRRAEEKYSHVTRIEVVDEPKKDES